MPAPQNGSLPSGFTLDAGMQLVVTALDPTTGAVVPNVIISNVSIDDGSGGVVSSLPPPLPVTGAYTGG